LTPLTQLSQALALRFIETRTVGDDLCIVARIDGHDQFLG
jgi:hypothetical protein